MAEERGELGISVFGRPLPRPHLTPSPLRRRRRRWATLTLLVPLLTSAFPLPSFPLSSTSASAAPSSRSSVHRRAAIRPPPTTTTPPPTKTQQTTQMLAVSFHPELTPDTRWHQYFATMVRTAKAKSS